MKLKIMSFNLRFNVASDGINSFDGRKNRVKETIIYENPEVIGFQEASDGMTEWLKSAIKSKYEIVGTGRNADRTGEGARIAYNKKKFELLSLDTKWLSETPDIPASRYSVDQSLCPRVYTVIELIEKKSRKIFRLYNVHLDHEGESAKLCGAVQLIQRMAEDNRRLLCVNILTGDFNALPESNTIKTISAHLNDLTSEISGTFHNYGKYTGEKAIKIDYIFTDGEKADKSYAVPDESVNGVYISDHYPICAFVKI